MQTFSSSPQGVAPRVAGRASELRAPWRGADLRPLPVPDDDFVRREKAQFEALRARIVRFSETVAKAAAEGTA